MRGILAGAVGAVRRLFAAIALAALGVASLLPIDAEAQTVADPDFKLKTVASLDFPVGMQFTPSGTLLFVNEREGRIRIIKNGKLLSQPFAIVNTTTSGEGGLLGLALHPSFETGQPWVYVFYTYTSDGQMFDRVERFRASGDKTVQRQIVFDAMPASQYHHGGSLAFGADGKLYVSNGEEHDSNKAQDPTVLGGKVYRLNADGSIPSDNPFSGEPTFAYGLRNPFGMTVDPTGGRIWVTENGPSEDDEVNLIVKGGNYGWPKVTGSDGSGGYRDPVLNYQNIVVPTMMAFGGSALPKAYRGNLFFGTYGQQTIHRVKLTASRTGASSDTIFIRPNQGVVGMTMGPDGLYYTTPTKVVRAYVPAAPAPAPVQTTPKPTPKPTPTKTPTPTPTPTSTPTPTPTPTPTSSETRSPIAAEPLPASARLPWLLVGAGAGLVAAGLLVWRFMLRPRGPAS
ncbi:MAG: PQQ-dependent sugar dehydrogenase [Actinomycetota bacterium]